MRAPTPTVIIPVKQSTIGKSRLRGSDLLDVNDELIRAIALDTIAAVCSAGPDALVVTNDPIIAAAARAAGARIRSDPPGAGLNEAIRHGETAAGLARPRIALAADLPALRPAELNAAIRAASEDGARRAFVADHVGTGTTLLWAPPGVPLRPLFGLDSAHAHAASGARALDGGWPSLRLDVDTGADLENAAALGLGPRTSAQLAPVER